MTGNVLPVGLLPTAAGGIQTIKADESDALRRDEQSGVGDEGARGPFSLAIPDGGIELGAVAYRRLSGYVGQFRQGQGGAGGVLCQADPRGLILGTDTYKVGRFHPGLDPAALN